MFVVKTKEGALPALYQRHHRHHHHHITSKSLSSSSPSLSIQNVKWKMFVVKTKDELGQLSIKPFFWSSLCPAHFFTQATSWPGNLGTQSTNVSIEREQIHGTEAEKEHFYILEEKLSEKYISRTINEEKNHYYQIFFFLKLGGYTLVSESIRSDQLTLPTTSTMLKAFIEVWHLYTCSWINRHCRRHQQCQQCWKQRQGR